MDSEIIKPPKCGICGEGHSPSECNIVAVQSYIPDRPVPSKARLSLPDKLKLQILADESKSICTLTLVEKGTKFGPLQAKKLCSLMPQIEFPLKIFPNSEEDLEEYYLDTSDEYECSWMIFVRSATSFEEQNLISYQESDDLYYVAIRDINVGEELKVWYAPYYATKMNKHLLLQPVVEKNVNIESNNHLEEIVRTQGKATLRDTWNCKFCGKVEYKVTEFATHLAFHYKAKLRNKCNICNDSFLTKMSYQKHMQIVHNKKTKLFNKENAAESYPLESVVTQKEQVTELPKTQDACLGGPLLLNNIASESLDNSGLMHFEQGMCNLLENENPMSQGVMNQSTMLESDNINLNVDSVLQENVKELDHFNFELGELETEQLICDVCLKMFTKLKYLLMHLESHTGKFICYDCNKVFARKETLKHHSCVSFFNFKCPYCDKLYYQQKVLNYHIKVYHDKKFACTVSCGRVFKSAKELEEHTCPLPTPKIKQFPCEVCGNKFTQKRNLQTHMKRHSDLKTKYTCPICGVELSYRETYLKHVRLHEGPRFVCDICNKSYKRKDILLEHKRMVHEGQMVSCEVCSKQIVSKNLKKHMLNHQPEKTFKCTICNNAYKQNRALQRHLKSHEKADIDSSNYPFFCPVCKKKMKHRYSVRRHLLIYHPTYEYKETKKRKVKPDPLDATDEESELDLKQTIENMNFNTDVVNTCENTDFTIEIEKILNDENIFLGESNDRLVDNLIDSAVKDTNLNITDSGGVKQKEVCLSMPDLTEGDQEIRLGENAYILENGTIVEPKENSSEVVVYVLNQDKLK
ncbi:unnamed protein product [Callosobruchus maculatus]|uniref:Uncharacterized protein n=1 Tax=Callosobruchus maculatus TaxID=64391 RepID=A0A653C3U7_CALMS|nr:unnamed protein product [Callosobruchus maculatus]